MGALLEMHDASKPLGTVEALLEPVRGAMADHAPIVTVVSGSSQNTSESFLAATDVGAARQSVRPAPQLSAVSSAPS